MNQTTIRRAGRCAALLFMATVTACLLAFVAGLASRGPSALPAVIVYAFASGFGLEFVASA